MTDGLGTGNHEKAAAIVTNRGGRTCHAALSRCRRPAVVGCGDATERMKMAKKVTVSCAEGDTGYVYADMLDFGVKLQRRHHAGATSEGHDECRQARTGHLTLPACRMKA